MKTMLFTSAIFILILYGCKAQQYSIDDLPEKQLIFGNGGGMSGMVKTYTLLENGQLFMNNSLTKESTEIGILKKKECKAVFKKLAGLKLREVEFDHPGNRYYFLEDYTDGEACRITWGKEGYEVASEIKNLYNQLNEIIKSL